MLRLTDDNRSIFFTRFFSNGYTLHRIFSLLNFPTKHLNRLVLFNKQIKHLSLWRLVSFYNYFPTASPTLGSLPRVKIGNISYVLLILILCSVAYHSFAFVFRTNHPKLTYFFEIVTGC